MMNLPADYRERLAGALLARCAGCTLGAPVEMWPIERMANLAAENGDDFPPTDYWRAVPDPEQLRYGMSPRQAYTRTHMNGVPVDDDIVYTLLGLLVLEDYGPDFTVADVGAAWLEYLPLACTAEKAALANLRAGVPAAEAADLENPHSEWIGADIRSDPWGYVCPGDPARAAAMAETDARLTHHRAGLDGEVYFSAVIAAAFTVDDPVDALRAGLGYIPADSELATALRWAFELAPAIPDYRAARAAVDERFPGMHPVHTLNNACLTVWGLTIGGRDVTRVLAETVAMGLDNDCTAATAGSIVGAVVGSHALPEHWTRPFGDTIHSYLTGHPAFGIADTLDRFTRQAKRV